MTSLEKTDLVTTNVRWRWPAVHPEGRKFVVIANWPRTVVDTIDKLLQQTVAQLQLLPAALLAPPLATLCDRISRGTALASSRAAAIRARRPGSSAGSRRASSTGA